MITHQKILSDCQKELSSFLNIMATLGDKLGPLLLQFPYFNKNAFASREQFDKLLRPFLGSLPKEFRFSIEIRNKNLDHLGFSGATPRDMLRGFHPLCPSLDAKQSRRLRRPWIWSLGIFAMSASWVTARSLESKTQKFDKILEDKTDEMTIWVQELKKIVAKRTKTYVFLSNYYAGYGPGSAKLFEELWNRA